MEVAAGLVDTGNLPDLPTSPSRPGAAALRLAHDPLQPGSLSLCDLSRSLGNVGEGALSFWICLSQRFGKSLPGRFDVSEEVGNGYRSGHDIAG